MSSPFFNELSEYGTINILLNSPENAREANILVADDFHDDINREIFSAIRELAMQKKPFDLVAVDTALSERLGASAGPSQQRLVEIATSLHYSSYMLKEYIEQLKACSMRRNIYLICEETQTALKEASNDSAAVLENTRQKLRDLVISRHAWKSMADVLAETFAALEKKSKGEEQTMTSGIAALDNITAGFHGGEFTIIGARPAVGKSAFGGFVALSASRSGYKVGICSREMTAVQYGTRIIAHGSEVDPKKLRTGELEVDDWVQVAQTLNLYSSRNVSFIFSAAYIEDLRMEVQRKVDAGDLDMLIVDYIQQMRTKQRFDKDYLRIAYISKMLKDMSTDFNISVVGLAQVGRQSDGAMPTLAELRGSGDLEQDADNVIFLHRPADASDKYVHPHDREIFSGMRNSGLQYIAISVAKQRQGEIGTLAVAFNPGRMRYTMIDRGQPSQAHHAEPVQVPDSDVDA